MRPGIVSLLLLAATVPAVAETPSQGSVAAVRDAGTALAAWFADHAGAADAVEASSVPTSVDWSRCPQIRHDEAARLLESEYIATLPRVDGWGHPLEFCLRREGAGGEGFSIGVRSPGRDGRWEGRVYPVGAFAADDLDRDLVWLDGVFVTWPQAR